MYRLGKMPIQSCGQSVSARCWKRSTETGLLASYDVASNIREALGVGEGREWAVPDTQWVQEARAVEPAPGARHHGRGLHSPTLLRNLSRFCP